MSEIADVYLTLRTLEEEMDKEHQNTMELRKQLAMFKKDLRKSRQKYWDLKRERDMLSKL